MSIIKTQNLTKYYGKSRGIEHVNLSVEEGEIFGFIGPNGAGKSTTIRTLMGLLFPTEGTATIFGEDVRTCGPRIRKNIGFIPGEVEFYDRMTAEELLLYSLRFFPENNTNSIYRLAEIVNLDLKRHILDLSQGNKKKVAILQAMIHNPKLLILDEPTTGLDPLIQAKFFELLKEANKNGTTIFFSSHTLSEIQKLCKRVAIIKNGSIAAIEGIESLRQKQLKQVDVDFPNKVPKNIPLPPGAQEITQGNERLSFLYSGNIPELLKTLSRYNIANLSIEAPDLEDIFMYYYEEGKPTT